jgi:hypothetical protein
VGGGCYLPEVVAMSGKILAKNELSVEEDKMNAKAIDVHFPISWMLGCVFV